MAVPHSGTTMRLQFFTICAANYLPFARTLHASLRDAGEDAPFTVFLADEVAARFDPALLPFPLVETRTLPLPAHFDMAARYTVMEMSTAVKPACIAWLFDTTDADAVIYLDPDILALRRFDDVRHALATAPLVLTPHATAPLDDGALPDDLTFLRTGAYNLGFCAFSRGGAQRRFLDWWARQLETRCVVDLPAGLFVDQKFMDLAPAMLPGTHILHHPGYNAAYWNLAHRPVTRGTDGWLAGGEALHFFHFSGVDPDDRRVFSRHQDRFDIADIGALGALLDEYRAGLSRHAMLGGVALRGIPYAYGHLRDGLPITDAMRAAYALARPGGSHAGYDSCFSPDLNIFCRLDAELPQEPGAPVTQLLRAIHDRRPDLRRSFPLDQPDARRALARWFHDSQPEHRTPAPIMAAHAAVMLGAAASPARPPGIDMHGYFGAESGIGQAVRRLWQAARAAGVPAQAHALPAPGFRDAVHEVPLAAAPPRHSHALVHINADQACRMHAHVAPDRLAGRHVIGAWYWELPRLPAAWNDAFAHVHEIWAASDFAARAFARGGVPVHVVPPPVVVPPLAQETPAERRARLGLPAEALVVLTAFDFGSFVARKNPLGALRAFQDAFAARENVVLVVKCHGRPRRDAQWRAFAEAAARDPRVLLRHEVMAPHDIAALQASADIFLSLHRAEGFGLWIAETMALGRAVVATQYSGNADFTDPDTAMPVGFRLVPVAAGAYPMGEGQLWAEPDHDEAVAALRRLAADAGLRDRLGAAAAARIAERYSPAAVGARIRERLGWAAACAGTSP